MMTPKIKLRKRMAYGKTTRAVETALDPGMKRAASHMVGVAQALVSTPFPPASSPGDPPHRRTGKLRSSINYKKKRKGLYEITAGGPDVRQAVWMEYGTTKPKGSIARRPFMRPMMVKVIGGLGIFFRRVF